jgi:hypothetical protein
MFGSTLFFARACTFRVQVLGDAQGAVLENRVFPDQRSSACVGFLAVLRIPGCWFIRRKRSRVLEPRRQFRARSFNALTPASWPIQPRVSRCNAWRAQFSISMHQYST